MQTSRNLSMLLLFVAGITLIRLLLAIFLPVTQDEAYYFYWARFLDWGYFDHPPLVAWLSALTQIWPESALAARAGTLLLSLAAFPVLWSLFKTLGLDEKPRTLIATILASSNLAAVLMGFVTTPDIPLVFCWIVALHEAAKALSGQSKRWLSAGLFTGLGILGKYTMLLIGPVFLIGLLAEPRRLRSPWPYLGGLVCVLVLLPHLLWLSHNDWITVRFQFGRGLKSEYGVSMVTASTLPLAQTPSKDGKESALASYFTLNEEEKPLPPKPPSTGLKKAFQGLGDFIGGQAALWGALLLPLLMALRHKRYPVALAPSLKALCWSACLVPLLLFGVLSPIQHIEANWPAMYLIGAAPLLALSLPLSLRSLLFASAINAALCISVLIHAQWPLSQKRPHKDRILRETHGYQLMTDWVAQQTPLIFTDTYQNAGQLSMHNPKLQVQQWPGIARTSELLRRKEMNPITWSTLAKQNSFYLLTDLFVPPHIPGAEIQELTEILDCTNGTLGISKAFASQAYQRPCPKRVHRWSLAKYKLAP